MLLNHGSRFATTFLSSLLSVWVGLVVATSAAPKTGQEAFVVQPSEVSLEGNFARVQVVVSQTDGERQPGQRSEDLTSDAGYESSDEDVFTVSSDGLLLAVGDGSAELLVRVGETTKEIPVVVEGVVDDPEIGFQTDVLPILSKAGCNMGACHAAQHGKGGFKLSVFGFEPSQDHQAIVRGRVGRRVNFLDPASSLFLQKPSMKVPHGGGLRLPNRSVDYRVLEAWIKSGAPGSQSDAPNVRSLSVTPTHRIGQLDSKQQLRVVASYSDGSSRDVTTWAKYDSMDDGVLRVSDSGLVTTIGRGQAAVMVRFEGQAEIAKFVVPYKRSFELTDWQSNNFVDELAAKKFTELGIQPSPLCDDATFLRRAFLDAIGTLPTPEEAEAFLESSDPDKRDKLIDRLLGLTGDPELDIYNDAYTSYWTLKWSDLIRNTSDKLGEQGMWSLHNWIRESFRINKPFDQFVRELVTGKGSIYSSGPANYFRINQNPSDLTESTSQLFLGVRLECTKCHHHPFEKYKQDDYYNFAAFFARVGTKNSEDFGLFGSEQVVLVKQSGEVRHPKTRQIMSPTPLEGESVEHPLDRRVALADWLTSPDNEYFAKAAVNRYVAYLLGRGLVDPVDDLRSTNPPSNMALMDALAEEFVESGFDLKHLMRTIMTSRLYQLDSQPTESNAADDRFYSHYRVKRLPAEALLDGIDQVTGVQTKFQNLPPGTRAIDLPDAEYPNYFLNTFAKPKRASVCECERSSDESLAQALHTLNGEILTKKIADKDGRVAELLADERPHEEIVQQLYLRALSRYPTDAELAASEQMLDEAPDEKVFYEDLLWALINSKQFLFNH